MELIHVTGNTYYIKNNTNIGIYKIDDENVYLIDTGNDTDAGKKILKIVEEQGWKVQGIINTHSNADHIGGNKVIEDRTNCEIFTSGLEACFTRYPELEPAFLYGAYPFKDLQNKFLKAKPSNVQVLDDNNQNYFEIIPLKGHFLDMIGIKTKDNVIFLADSLFSEETINKYHVFFIYDVKEYLHTLDILENLEGSLFIPSHTEATKDISSLIKLNRDKINQILAYLCEILEKELIFEDILKNVFDKFSLVMNANQYVLVGSTIKSYLAYLIDENKVSIEFKDNYMYYKIKKEGE